MKRIAAFLVFASCATFGIHQNDGRIQGAATAAGIVWQSYGMPDKAPSIDVVQGARLDCVDPFSNKMGFHVLLTSDSDGTLHVTSGCREGYTVVPWESSVSWHGEPWSETALAHELMHQAQFRRGIIDSDHRRPEWTTDVPKANALLKSQGM
jgi:hypothetical protein